MEKELHIIRPLLNKLKIYRTFSSILNPGISLVLLGIMLLCAIFAPYLAPHDPNKGNLYNQYIVPMWMEGGSSDHILGTDFYGRDILSRLIYGARVSLSVAFIAIIVSTILGTVTGLIAGYLGGFWDTIIMRVVDGILSIPYLMIAIVLVAVIGASFWNLILIIAFFTWPMYSRQIRAEALSIREMEYVRFAWIAGESVFRILYKHFFFNVVPTILVMSTFRIGEVIMVEAMLSFLGVGVPPPTASWGSMASEGQEVVTTLWWISAIPGFAILVTILCANIFGDWLRDRLDPKLRQL